jgi:hypothetical protein
MRAKCWSAPGRLAAKADAANSDRAEVAITDFMVILL